MLKDAKSWANIHNKLHGEYRLTANPHYYPMNKQQKSKLRNLKDIEKDIDTNFKSIPNWKGLPLSGWISEKGTQDFAAFKTITLSEEDSKAYERWQIQVAIALNDENQEELNDLFSNIPGNLEERNSLFYIRKEDGTIIIRDSKGQPLPDDFEVTPEHLPQCFDGLIPDRKK